MAEGRAVFSETERGEFVDRLESIPNLVDFFAGIFAEAPFALQIYRADGHPILTNAAFKKLFGFEPPPRYNILKDKIALANGVLDAIHRAFAGEVVTTPTIWYSPKKLNQAEVQVGNRVAMSSTFFPLHGLTGEIEYVGLMIHDQTVETTVREAIERQSATQSLAQKVAHLGYWELDLGNTQDLNHNPLRWSDEVFRIFGYEPAGIEVTNEVFFKAVHPEDVEKVREAVRRALDEGEDYWLEHRVVWPSGEVRWVLEQSHTERKADGTPIRMLGTVHDISDRVKIENVLRDTEQNLRKIIDLIPHPIYCKDCLGRLLFANGAFFKLTSTSPERLPKLQQSDWCETEEQAQKYREEDEEVARLGVPKFIAHEIYRDKQGRAHTLQTTKVPFAVAGTRENAVLAISIDISDLKSVESQLQEQNALFSGMMESTDEPIFAVDKSGNCTQFNSAFAALIHRAYGPKAMEGHGPLHEVMAEEDRHRFLTWIQRAARGERFADEFYFKAVDAWYEVSLNPIRSVEGEVVGVAVFLKNVTAKRAALQAIREMNLDLERRVEARTSELERANKELESFAYSISHDLRSPLRAIEGFSEILGSEFGDILPEEGREHLFRVRKASHRMGELIDGLLAFSRLGRQALVCRRLSTAELVGEALDELSALAKGRDIQYKIGVLPPCSADRILIRTVFSNLIENAIKFTSTQKNAVIEISTFDRDGQTVWFVKDNGVGFDMKYSAQLFGVFNRLHGPDEFEGTGVGLALVQRIIMRHGGEIWAESEPDRGACFYFTLGHAEVTRIERSRRDLAS